MSKLIAWPAAESRALSRILAGTRLNLENGRTSGTLKPALIRGRVARVHTNLARLRQRAPEGTINDAALAVAGKFTIRIRLDPKSAHFHSGEDAPPAAFVHLELCDPKQWPECYTRVPSKDKDQEVAHAT